MCIVMTTGLIEGKRRKCDRYWPDTAAQQKQVQYGDVTVEVIDEVDYSGIWVLSTFNVSKGNETRQAKHFWYTGWPDHGVPETACDVIEFLRAVKRETETNTVCMPAPLVTVRLPLPCACRRPRFFLRNGL